MGAGPGMGISVFERYMATAFLSFFFFFSSPEHAFFKMKDCLAKVDTRWGVQELKSAEEELLLQRMWASSQRPAKTSSAHPEARIGRIP